MRVNPKYNLSLPKNKLYDDFVLESSMNIEKALQSLKEKHNLSDEEFRERVQKVQKVYSEDFTFQLDGVDVIKVEYKDDIDKVTEIPILKAVVTEL